MDFLLLVKIYLLGLMVLVVAILVNALASLLNLMTWYRFIKLVGADGIIETIFSLSFFSALFLFIVYPLFLGLIGFWAYRIIF